MTPTLPRWETMHAVSRRCPARNRREVARCEGASHRGATFVAFINEKQLHLAVNRKPQDCPPI